MSGIVTLRRVAYPAILFALLGTGAIADTARAPLIEELMWTYGYCDTQNYVTERIKQTAPAHAGEVMAAKHRFDAVFGTAAKAVEVELKKLSGKDWPKVRSIAQESNRKAYANRPFSEQEIRNFIEALNRRAKGEVDSPALETLLSYHPAFQRRPHEEMSRGFTKTFRSAGHAKAKGVDIQFKYPASWRPREGNRPNVVQYFGSRNGHGFDAITLTIRTSPDGKPFSAAEIKETFSYPTLKGLVPPGGTFAQGESVVLDHHPGALVIADFNQRQLNQDISLRMANFYVADGAHMVILQCGTGGPKSIIKDVPARFEQLRTLCLMVGNSVIFPSQYQEHTSTTPRPK